VLRGCVPGEACPDEACPGERAQGSVPGERARGARAGSVPRERAPGTFPGDRNVPRGRGHSPGTGVTILGAGRLEKYSQLGLAGLAGWLLFYDIIVLVKEIREAAEPELEDGPTQPATLRGEHAKSDHPELLLARTTRP